MSNCAASGGAGGLIHFCKKTITGTGQLRQCTGSSGEDGVATGQYQPQSQVAIGAGVTARRLVRLVRKYLYYNTIHGGQQMWPCGACHHHPHPHDHPQYHPPSRSRTKLPLELTKHLGTAIRRDTANAMCKDKPSDNNKTKARAASEVPVANVIMAPSPQINRASSIGPILGLSNKRSFRDKGAYECNYESIDSWSSSSNEADSSSSAIWKLESTVKSIDNLIEKPKHYDSKVNTNSDKSNSKIQYDSITVLPPPPPPPLPRTRSFKHYRARTVHPWVSAPHTVGGRASSAPPISPLHQRRVIFSDR